MKTTKFACGSMKIGSTLLFGLTLLLLGCGPVNSFHEVKVDNPEYYPDTAFTGYEDFTSPKFQALKEKYQLDTIFHGETDEWKRILLLRNWIHNHIRIDNYGPFAGDGSVESILDNALKGEGYHCGHYTAVQNAIMNAYGYVTRCLIVDTGEPVDYIVGGGHHAINEVWSNQYQKWIVCDAKYDFHFEKDGVPLSALEIRDEYFKNKAADINGKMPTSIPELRELSMGQFASIYTWLSWGKYGNRYSSPEKVETDYMVWYEDDYSKNHTWLWDGKKHWAYGKGLISEVSDRNAIEWTPNTISSKVTIDGSKANIELISNTPSFKTYQMKELPGTTWKDVPSNLSINLENERNEFVFRTLNLAGVTGPEHRIVIAKE